MKHTLVLFTTCLIFALATGVRAQTLEWDPNTGTAGAQGGNGNWLTGTPWLSGSVNQAWNDGANAVFGGTAGTVTLNAAATANRLGFNTNGYVLDGSGTLTMGAPAVLTAGTGVLATISLALAGSNGVGIEGPGNVTFGIAQLYTGGTNVAGTLTLSAGGSLNAASALNVGGTFDMTNRLQAVSSLSGGGTILLGNGTLTTGSDGTDSAFFGAIGGTGGVTKTGSGTFTFNGLSATNTYSGSTTIASGVMVSSNGGVSDQSTVVLANAPNVEFRLNNLETIGALSGGGGSGEFVNVNGQELIIGANNTDAVFSGAITSPFGGGTLTKIGTGTQTLGSALFINNAVNVNGGTLRLGSNAGGIDLAIANVAGAKFDLNGRNVDLERLSGGGPLGGEIAVGGGFFSFGEDNSTSTFGGVISGPGFIRKNGTGTFTLSGPNTFSAQLEISGGLLRLGADNALPAAGSVIVTGTTRLDLDGFDTSLNSLFANNGAVLELDSSTLTLGAADGDSTIFSLLSDLDGPDFGRIVKAGAGTLTFFATTSFNGTVEIQGGTVSIQALSETALASATFQFANTPGAVLDVSFALREIDKLTGGGAAGGSVNVPGNGAIVVGGQGGSSTFSGSITGTGGLRKSGAGTFTFAGIGSFQGPVLVSAGTLLVNGSIQPSNGTVAVTAGGTLGGNGTINRQVQLLNGGNLAPGGSVGTLTVTSISLSDGANLSFELAGAANYDQLVISNNASFDQVNLNLSLLGGFARIVPRAHR